jgi:hypothetical protein
MKKSKNRELGDLKGIEVGLEEVVFFWSFITFYKRSGCDVYVKILL